MLDQPFSSSAMGLGEIGPGLWFAIHQVMTIFTMLLTKVTDACKLFRR